MNLQIVNLADTGLNFIRTETNLLNGITPIDNVVVSFGFKLYKGNKILVSKRIY